MKKLIIALGLVAVASCGYSQMMAVPGGGRKSAKQEKVRPPIDVAKRAEIKAKREQRAMEQYGGNLLRPNSQKGEIVLVDGQKRISKAWIDEVLLYFTEETNLKFGYKQGAFDFAAPKIEGNLTLFLVDDAKLPAILVAPENRWAMLNAATLAKEERPAFFQARCKKQLSRTLALLCGASNSQFHGALTRGIVDEADLDKNIDYVLPIDVFNRMRTYLEPYGVSPAKYVAYDIACEEGWAPNPTNKYQQAAWDEVHKLPTKPIKIEPEKK